LLLLGIGVAFWLHMGRSDHRHLKLRVTQWLRVLDSTT